MNKYYHNPKCSKSRGGLELLKEEGIEVKVIEYLKEPLSETDLEEIFMKLNKDPIEVVRRNEEIYSELNLEEKELSPKEWNQVIRNNPRLLQRPILVTENAAVIGRPIEDLKKIF